MMTSISMYFLFIYFVLSVELRSVLTQSSLLTSEMVHYIHQVQYYILFEVMECAFENFAQKFKTATSIEEVINEHEKFLQEIKAKTFLDDDDKSKVSWTRGHM